LSDGKAGYHHTSPVCGGDSIKESAMPVRGNKPVGRTAKILLVLAVAAILAATAIGIIAVRNQQAYPARGAASLPGQAGTAAGAQPGERPASQ
jgi:hypothetical protein